jgi:hypothetical protein
VEHLNPILLASLFKPEVQVISMALDTAPEKFESAQGQRTRNSASAPTNPLTPEKKTQHASGNEIIEYVYYPKKGKTQRVCGILGKDKRVSHCSIIQMYTSDQVGDYSIRKERVPGSSRG